MPVKKNMGFYIHHIDACYYKLLSRYLRDLDITPSQFEIIKFLKLRSEQGNDVIQKDIENYLHISNPTVSGMISRLEQKGFVSRVRSDRDRRICLIVPTDKARELEAKMKELSAQQDKLFIDYLGQEEYDGLLKQMETMLNVLVEKEKEERLSC